MPTGNIHLLTHILPCYNLKYTCFSTENPGEFLSFIHLGSLYPFWFQFKTTKNKTDKGFAVFHMRSEFILWCKLDIHECKIMLILLLKLLLNLLCNNILHTSRGELFQNSITMFKGIIISRWNISVCWIFIMK